MSDPMNFDREGTFRGEIIEYALQDAKDSQAVGIGLKVRVHEAFNFENETWEDWRQWCMEGYGAVWIIKKDGTVNQNSAESFIQATGWSGNLNDIATGEFQPHPIQFTVKAEQYKGQTQYKVGFIKPYDASPSRGMRKMDNTKAQSLQAALGGQLRALAGNVKAKAPPAGKPPVPPSSRSSQEADALAATAPQGDEPPFDKF
jgi:hypothetical protein